MDSTSSFGRWLMNRRQGLDLTRDDLAALVGCAPVTVAKIERDERRPSRQMAERLAYVLRVPAEGRAEFVRQARGTQADSESEPYEPSIPGHVALLPRSDLPMPPTSFVGRTDDIARVRSILWRTDTRLITLTGAPGIGKTRLSLAVASSMSADFADGAHWVPLAPVMEPGLLASTIAHALSLREVASQDVGQTLRDYLSDKQMLLLLDNFEHLISAAPLLSPIMSSAPRLKILVTSREILHLYGEHEYRVPPLQVPSTAGSAANDSSQQTLEEAPSIALFVQRAQAVKPDFTLTPANQSLVARICARLEGLPLAIELAAARTRLLDLETILARLENKLSLLTGGPRDLPVRHQTLHAAIDWSYSLLSNQEKILFRRLSVFAGGCDLEAIEAICAPDLAPDVLDLVSSLLDKSLVQCTTHAADTRFSLLEMIRDYAAQRLEETGETEVVKRRIAEHFARYLAAAEPMFRGPQQTAIFSKLDNEYDNLRALISWAMIKHGEIAQRLAAPLWRFWAVRGYVSEGRACLAKALAASGKRTLARARTSQSAGALAQTQADYASARAYLQEGLEIFEELGDLSNMARALNSLGLVAWGQLQIDLARDYFTRALVLQRDLGEKWGVAASLANLGMLEDNNYAREYLEESYRLFIELGDKSSATVALNNLGVQAHREGNLEEARRHWEECAAHFREMNNKESLGLALTNLAVVARDSGRFDEARELNREGLDIARGIGDLRVVGHTLDRMAGMAALEQQYEKSALLFGAVTQHLSDWNMLLPPASQRDHDKHEALAISAIGEARYSALKQQGASLTLDEALDLGLSSRLA